MTAPVLGPILPPVHKRVRVPWGVDQAFRRFTRDLASWWPLATHSVGQKDAVRCVFDERAGGEIWEEHRNGTRCVWGTVLVWEPPTRVRFTWHPGREPETFGEVELSFRPAGDGTELELVHSGWERLGRQARLARRGYNLGWSYVLQIYLGRRGPLVLSLDLLTRVVQTLRRRRPAATGARG